MSDNLYGQKKFLAEKTLGLHYTQSLLEQKIRFDLKEEEDIKFFTKTLRLHGWRMLKLYNMCDISKSIQEIPMKDLVGALKLKADQ